LPSPNTFIGLSQLSSQMLGEFQEGDDIEVGTSQVLHFSKFKTMISSVNHLILTHQKLFKNVIYVSRCLYGHMQISNVL
jgi:hypothetical protein